MNGVNSGTRIQYGAFISVQRGIRMSACCFHLNANLRPSKAGCSRWWCKVANTAQRQLSRFLLLSPAAGDVGRRTDPCHSAMSDDAAASGSGSPAPAAVPSPEQLEAETAALVSSGLDGWMVCWSKRLSRRYWYRKPTRTSKETTQWEPPTSPQPEPYQAEAVDEQQASKKRRLTADGSQPLDPASTAAVLVPSITAPASCAVLTAVLSVDGRLRASQSTQFSDQQRFDAVVQQARRVLAIHLFASTDTAALTTLLSPATPLPPSLPHLLPPPHSSPPEHPSLLTARRTAFNACERQLNALCRTIGLASGAPVNAFQRWGFSQRMLSLPAAYSDPLLPVASGEDEALRDELVREGAAVEKASWVCRELSTLVTEKAKEIIELKQKHTTTPSLAQIPAGCIQLSFMPPPPPTLPPASQLTIRYVDLDSNRPLYTIPLNLTHWYKLVRLYATHTTTSPYTDTTQLHYTDDFLHRTFALLARYDTIGGAGYQAAMPEPAFDHLTANYAVTTECFASPLNCYLSQFHSAFPDTDGPYGSNGSFFALRCTTGSYESNPPFLELNMCCNALMVLLLLERAEYNNAALQFVVVWPGWDDTPGYTLLMESGYCRRFLSLGKYEHTFKEGFQHRSEQLYRSSQAKSFVFWMQTSEASRRYPVTEEGVAEFRRTFQYTDRPQQQQQSGQRPRGKRGAE